MNRLKRLSDLLSLVYFLFVELLTPAGLQASSWNSNSSKQIRFFTFSLSSVLSQTGEKERKQQLKKSESCRRSAPDLQHGLTLKICVRYPLYRYYRCRRRACCVSGHHRDVESREGRVHSKTVALGGALHRLAGAFLRRLSVCNAVGHSCDWGRLKHVPRRRGKNIIIIIFNYTNHSTLKPEKLQP